MGFFVGIDIGKSSVKAASVLASSRRRQLLGLGEAPVGEAGIDGAIRAAVTAATSGKVSSADGIAVSFDGRRTSVRSLELPKSAEKQIADVLRFELEGDVPLDLDLSVFDYRVTQSKNVDRICVLATIAQTDEVRGTIDDVKRALGTEPDQVVVGPFAYTAVGTSLPPDGEQPLVLLDIGQSTTELLVFVRGEPAFARTLSFGTEGLPGSAAEIARSVRRSLVAYRAQGGDAPSKFYVTGGGALVAGSLQYLAAELGAPVEAVTLSNFERSEKSAAPPEELAKYMKAVSLGLGLGARKAGLNLRRGPLAYERGFGWIREKIPAITAFVALLAVSFGFATWARFRALAMEQQAVEGALSIVTKEVLGEETASPSRIDELLAAKGMTGDDDPMPHADAFHFMVALAEGVPADVKHDVEELDVNRSKVTLRGIVGSIPDAEKVATGLRKDRCVSDVQIKQTTAAVGGERVKYLMEIELKCPEDRPKPAKTAAAPSASAGGK